LGDINKEIGFFGIYEISTFWVSLRGLGSRKLSREPLLHIPLAFKHSFS
jgi:hypothetical protein